MEISEELIRTELELLVKGDNTLEETIIELVAYIKWRDEAINYTKCCEELKDKEAISFKEWIKLNKHTDTYNDFLEGGFTYTLGDLYREYSKDETNL